MSRNKLLDLSYEFDGNGRGSRCKDSVGLNKLGDVIGLGEACGGGGGAGGLRGRAIGTPEPCICRGTTGATPSL